MPKLFISHASEDKDRFVRPLAEALGREGLEVWYDEYELTVGDRLREKIDEGLKRSDYGVVILSRAFFQKKWTRDELEGLFALERANRKMILPVWLDVTAEEVASFSPILAGRLGADGSLGVDAVVRELRKALEVAKRTLEVNAPTQGRDKLMAINQKLSAKAAEDRRLFSIPGAQKVMAEATQIAKVIEAEIEHVNSQSEQRRFIVRMGSMGTILVRGPHGVFFDTSLTQMAQNSAHQAEFRIRIAQFTSDIPGTTLPDMLAEMVFKPRMLEEEQVTWAEEDAAEGIMTSVEAATRIIQRFGECIEDQ